MPPRPTANPQGNPRKAAEGSSKPPPALPPGSVTNEIPDAGLDVLPPPPAPPEELGEEGAAIWREVWEDGVHAYQATDRHVIARYCSLQERRLLLLRVLDDEGFTTVGSQGQTVAHPAAKLLSDTEAKLLPLEDRLGLNPEARIRLGLGAQQLRRSALDDFLSGDDHEEVPSFDA